jgi:hypothetical protein
MLAQQWGLVDAHPANSGLAWLISVIITTLIISVIHSLRIQGQPRRTRRDVLPVGLRLSNHRSRLRRTGAGTGRSDGDCACDRLCHRRAAAQAAAETRRALPTRWPVRSPSSWH